MYICSSPPWVWCSSCVCGCQALACLRLNIRSNMALGCCESSSLPIYLSYLWLMPTESNKETQNQTRRTRMTLSDLAEKLLLAGLTILALSILRSEERRVGKEC